MIWRVGASDKPGAVQGFSLPAATCCEDSQRDRLEKLCRYITRPAIVNERLSTNERGQVIYKFKQPFRDGTTHVVLDPLDFIARLAALVPRPRLNLTRFHGVFAPNYKRCETVVRKRKPSEEKTDIPLAPMTWMEHSERQVGVAKQLFAAMGVAREEKEGRQDWVLHGFRQFDAPVCVIITYDRVLADSDDTAIDCGAVTTALVNAA